ncbi:uncharacterized protein V6R79_014146 [Siganus canaliculatus]
MQNLQPPNNRLHTCNMSGSGSDFNVSMSALGQRRGSGPGPGVPRHHGCDPHQLRAVPCRAVLLLRAERVTELAPAWTRSRSENIEKSSSLLPVAAGDIHSDALRPKLRFQSTDFHSVKLPSRQMV